MSFRSKAVVMREIGAPDVLEIRDLELPWPGKDDQVLVRLEAAGVNPADPFFRALGTYLGEGPGTVLGHDGAGVRATASEGSRRHEEKSGFGAACRLHGYRTTGGDERPVDRGCDRAVFRLDGSLSRGVIAHRVP